MSKQTNEERIHSVKIKKVGFVYAFLARLLGPIMKRKYGVIINDKIGIKKVREQHIFISNHTSRIDYFFNAFYPMPNKYNFVVGYNEFYRKQFVLIAKLARLIPKKNFTADFYTAKEMNRVIAAGGNIAIFVEGMNSIRGTSQPVAPGTGKFIKHFKLPVYYSHISGGFMTTPKFALDERPGTVEVTYDRMFTSEQIENLSEQEIEDIMNEKLYNDDFIWNKDGKYHYKNDGNMAKNLHTLLYKCPKCGSEFENVGEGNTITCKKCGNQATLDDTYRLIPTRDSIIPKNITEWCRYQRDHIKKQLEDRKFSFTVHVKLGMLPEDHLIEGDITSEIVGEGELTIDFTGLTYKGSKNGEDFEFHIDSSLLPTYGMCTDISRFYTFYNGVFVEFYPDLPCVEKIFEITEEIHRLNGGKWKDYKFAH